MKIKLALILVFCCMLQTAKADTKVLRNISVTVLQGLYDEKILLDNDKDLVIEGYQVQRFDLPNDLDHELKIILEFVGDKDGYRAKYTITQEEATERLRLNPSSLKSLSG